MRINTRHNEVCWTKNSKSLKAHTDESEEKRNTWQNVQTYWLSLCSYLTFATVPFTHLCFINLSVYHIDMMPETTPHVVTTR